MKRKSSKVKKETSMYKRICAKVTDFCLSPVLQVDKVFSKTNNIFLAALGLPLYIISILVPVVIIGIPLLLLSLYGVSFLAWLYHINTITKVIAICLIIYIISLISLFILKGDDICK